MGMNRIFRVGLVDIFAIILYLKNVRVTDETLDWT